MPHDKDELKRENQRLRELVVSLSVMLLRKIAAEPFRDRAPPPSSPTMTLFATFSASQRLAGRM
jgi:hypothetical protein